MQLGWHNQHIRCFISADQQEALRQFREKEDEWERMRKRLEKQVTKLSESIASSRRNSLTPWGMSLLSWLNLDSDHASGQDDNDYEEGSHDDGNNDDYLLSGDNDDNDGGYGTTNGVVNTDSSDVMVLRSGSSVPAERGGGDADVDAGWSRDHPMSRLRSRSRFRSRDERQSRSEAHDRSPLLPRDRSQSRSPTRPTWETASSGRRRFSRSRHARPLSRHLSRTRPDLTTISDVPVESNSDQRSSLRGGYFWPDYWADPRSGPSSAAESNWSYRDEDVFLSDTYYSDHSSPYYTHGSPGEGDYDDFPADDVSQHESLSPVGGDTEEDTRTVVSISDSHISAEFSQQEDSDGEAARSPGEAPVSESVSDDHVSTGSHGTVDSQSPFDDSNGHEDNGDDGGHIFDDVTGGSSDGSRCVDDTNDIGHSDEPPESYLQSGVHTNTGSPPDDYADLCISSYTYHDREPLAADTRAGPATEHSTGSSGDLRETIGEGRPDFNNIIRDSDIMVSAEETVGGDHDAGQNKASSSLADGVGSSRKRRRHDDEADGGFASSRKKLKWHEPTDPWAAPDRWPADGVYDYYTRDYVNGTASSGSFRLNRADSRTSTVTSSAGSRAVGDVQVSSHPRRRHRHAVRRHTSVGRMSTLTSSSQPSAEARDRVTSQSGSANEATTTDVHRRTASKAALHAAPFSAAARGDATDGVSRRRHTIENTDGAATTRSGRRSSRRHRNRHDGRHDSRGGDQLLTRPLADVLDASDSDDTLWQPDGGDGGHSSDHSQSTEEPTSDSSYEVLVPKTWVQMLNEYDSQDSDHSWRP